MASSVYDVISKFQDFGYELRWHENTHGVRVKLYTNGVCDENLYDVGVFARFRLERAVGVIEVVILEMNLALFPPSQLGGGRTGLCRYAHSGNARRLEHDSSTHAVFIIKLNVVNFYLSFFNWQYFAIV